MRATAMRILSYREHSVGGLRDKLAKREYNEANITAVLDELEADNYLDDRRFAEHQAAILARKQWGPIRIEQKLTRHGVPKTLAAETVDQLGRDHSWLSTCRDRVVSRFGEPDGLSQHDKERAYRHMKHRGYHPSTIRRVIFDDAGC